MFESILEKILLNNFGQFITGLDRKNLHLGVWAGNLVIENVNLKPEVVDMLDIPIVLRFSSIGKLQIQVPWSSLSSSPVEVSIDKILVIVSPKSEKTWVFKDLNTFNLKLALVQDYAKKCVEKFIQKQLEKDLDPNAKGQNAKQKASYMEKMYIKILDNIQLTINNIHIRYEDSDMAFSWGITLDEIMVVTTDENWKKNFIDRTDKANEKKPMFKLLVLQNLGIYWNSKEKLFLAESERYTVVNKLSTMIFRKADKEGSSSNSQYLEYVININAEAKLIQMPKDNFEVPEFQVLIDLNWIDLRLKNSQLEQVFMMLESFINFNKKMMVERKKAYEVSISSLSFYEENFNSIFTKIELSEEKNLKDLTLQEKNVFEAIITSTPPEELLKWVKKCIKEIQKKIQIEELSKKTKKKKEGWSIYQYLGYSTIENLESVNLTDIKEIEEYIEKSFMDQSLETVECLRPPESPFFCLNFQMKGLSIYLSKTNNQNHEEGVKLKSTGLVCDVRSFNDGRDINVKLKDINLDMLTEYSSSSPVITPIIYRRQKKVSKGEHIFNFLYEQNPYGRAEDAALSCWLDAVDIVYNPIAIHRLTEFFKVKSGEEIMKTAAWEQIEKIQDSTQETFQQLLTNYLKLKLRVEIASPILIIPYLHNNDPATDCWVLNLGNFSVLSNDEYLSPKDMVLETQVYDHFLMELSKIKMQYFPSRSYFEKYMLELLNEDSRYGSPNTDSPQKEKCFNLIEEFSIKTEIKTLKKNMNQFVKDKPKVCFSGEVPEIMVNLNKAIYKKLVALPNILSDTEIKFEALQNEKAALVRSEYISGWILKRGTMYKDWFNYYVIFSGGYLYFFHQIQDLVPVQSIYIKEACIYILDKTESDEPHSLKIKNRYYECYLAFKSDKEMKDWTKIMEEKIKLFSVRISEGSLSKLKEKVKSEEISVETQEILLEAFFKIDKISLIVRENNKSWLDISIKGLSCLYNQRMYDLSCDFKLDSVLLWDTVFQFENPYYQNLVTNFPESESGDSNHVREKLIQIYLVAKEPKHPEFKDVDIDMKIKCGSLFINWKPDTLLKIGEYISMMKGTAEAQGSRPHDNFTPTPPRQSYIPDIRMSSSRSLENAKSHLRRIANINFSKVFLAASFEMEEISINLLHKQTHTCLGQAILSGVDLKLLLKPLHISLNGSLADLKLFEKTNFPHTLDSNRYYERIIPSLIFSLLPSEKKRLFSLQLESYELEHPVVQDNISTEVTISISPVLLNWHHQAVMRLIDYFLLQILSLVVTPEFLMLNEEYYLKKSQDDGGMFERIQIEGSRNIKKKEKQEIEFKPKMVVGDFEEVRNRLIKPSFTKIIVHIEKPIINLKPHPNSNEYIQLELGKITIETEQRDSGLSRVLSGQSLLDEILIWEDVYNISFPELGIRLKRGDQTIEIAAPVHMNLRIVKMSAYDDLDFLFGGSIALDKTIIIEGAISPVILKTYRDEYLAILKVLFHNIVFDDLNDELFIFDFDIVSKFKPTPIYFQLDFFNITIFMMDSNTNNTFGSISVKQMRVLWTRDQNGSTELKVMGQKLQSSYFDAVQANSTDSRSELIEKWFIGAYIRTNTHRVSINPMRLKKFDLEETLLGPHLGRNVESEPIYKMPDFNESKVEFKVVLTSNSAVGDTNIKITISNVKILAHTSIFMSVLNFFETEPSVYPDTEPAKHEIEESALSLIVDIQNAIFCIPSQNKSSVLASRGDFSIVYSRNKLPSFTQMYEEFNTGISSSTKREANKYCITFSEMEILICELSELVSLPFNQVRKRNIFMPFSWFYGAKNYICLERSTKNCIFWYNKNEAQFEKTVLRLTYQDLKLILAVINYQKEEFKKIDEKKQPEVAAEKKVADISSKYENFYEVVFQGLQICIINDSEDAFVPVLDLTLYDSQLILMDTVKTAMTSVISFSASYYNVYLSRWEPILEKIGLEIDYSHSENSNPMKYINIQMRENYENLDINISNHMIVVLYSTLSAWMREFDQQNINSDKKPDAPNPKDQPKYVTINESHKSKPPIYDSSWGLNSSLDLNASHHSFQASNSSGKKRHQSLMLVQEEDVVDYVSPYTIRNETGYQIEIVRDLGAPGSSQSNVNETKTKYILNNGNTMNFQIETDVGSMFARESKTSSGQRKVKVTILHPYNRIKPLEGIDLDKMRTRRVKLNGDSLALNDFHLITTIKVHGTGRMLKISSEIMLFNNLDRVLEFQLFEDKKPDDKFLVSPGQEYNLPFDKINHKLSFRFYTQGETLSYCQPILFKKILEMDSESSYEVNHGPYYNTILYVKKESGVLTVILEPCFILKNCLPFEMNFEICDEITKTRSFKEPMSRLESIQPSKQDSQLRFDASGDGIRYRSDGDSLKKISTLFLQQTYQEHCRGTSQKLIVKIRVQGFGWSDPIIIYTAAGSERKKEIPITDLNGNTAQVLMFSSPNDKNFIRCKKFFFYCRLFVVNETPYDFIYYTVSDKTKKINPGQVQTLMEGCKNDKITMISDNPKTLIVAMPQDEEVCSKEFPINSLGSSSIDLKAWTEEHRKMTDIECFEFGVNISHIEVEKDLLFTRVLRISPRYIIVNWTKFELTIMQYGVFRKLNKRVAPQERIPFYWPSKHRSKFLSVSIEEIKDSRDQRWGPSGPLDVNINGISNFLLRLGEKKREMKFLKMDTRVEKHIIYVIFSESDDNSANYMIINEFQEFQLEVRQKKCDDFETLIVPESSYSIFAWDAPTLPLDVVIRFRFKEPKNYSLDHVNNGCIVNFNEIDTYKSLKIAAKTPLFEDLEIGILVYIEGPTRKLRFIDKRENKLSMSKSKAPEMNPLMLRPPNFQKTSDDQYLLQFKLNLKAIGVSLISDYKRKRMEIIYLTFLEPEMMILEKACTRIFHFRIKYIKIDNNTSLLTQFPVLLTPNKHKELMNSGKYLFDLCLVENSMAKEIVLVNSLRCHILPISIKFNDEFLDILSNFIDCVINVLASTKKKYNAGYIQSIYGDNDDNLNTTVTRNSGSNFKAIIDSYEWQNAFLPKTIKSIYINEVVLSPIFIYLSFQKKVRSSSESDPFFFTAFLNAVGLAITNLDEAPIILNGFKVYSCLDSTEGIKQKLINHYKENILKTLFKVIGSIDILGNPVGLINNIQAGFVDLIDKPMEGFVEGPLEVGAGIMKGAGSLLKNTFAGTLNSVQKIAGSVATGISSLSLDEEYLNHREKIKIKKPKHLVDGLGQGVLSIFSGIEKGITGVISKPVEGARKGGVSGFLFGSFQGIAGLIIKPVTGIIDATSKTAEGIKNTATYLDDKPNEKRSRIPRAFYSKEKYYKSYIRGDSEMIYFLQSFKKGKYANISFVDMFYIKMEKIKELQECWLVLSNEVLLYFLRGNLKLLWSVDVSNISKLERDETNLKLCLFNATKKLKNKQASILLEDEEVREQLIDVIYDLLEQRLQI